MEGGKERRGAYDIAAELMEHTLPGKEDYTKIIHPTSVTEKREGVIHLYMYQYRGRGGVETQGAYSLERGRVHINHLGIMTDGELLKARVSVKEESTPLFL